MLEPSIENELTCAIIAARKQGLLDAKALVKVALKTSCDPRSIIAIMQAIDTSVELLDKEK